MNKQIPKPVIAIAVVVALGAAVLFFTKASQDPAPTVTNLPDYSKMSGADIAKAKEASMAAEHNMQRP